MCSFCTHHWVPHYLCTIRRSIIPCTCHRCPCSDTDASQCPVPKRWPLRIPTCSWAPARKRKRGEQGASVNQDKQIWSAFCYGSWVKFNLLVKCSWCVWEREREHSLSLTPADTHLTFQHRRVARHHVLVVHLHRVLLVDNCRKRNRKKKRLKNIAHTQRVKLKESAINSVLCKYCAYAAYNKYFKQLCCVCACVLLGF